MKTILLFFVVLIVAYFLIRLISAFRYATSNEANIIAAILDRCDFYIDTYEKWDGDPTAPSCKNELHKNITTLLYSRKNEFKQWNGSEDIDSVARAVVSQVSFQMLMSGKYHVAKGILNPRMCGSNLLAVHKAMLSYCHNSGEIDDDTYQSELAKLEAYLKSVG